MTASLQAAALVAVTLYASCASQLVDVVFYRDDGDRFSLAERWLIESIAEDTVAEVRQRLPSLPDSIILRVHQHEDVLAETGERGGVSTPNVVSWIVDATHEAGVSAIARERLRTTLYHHLAYLARHAALDEPHTVLNDSIAFGLAAAFARDFGGADVPWSAYPVETADWVPEVLSVADDMTSVAWMSRLLDGRRLVGPAVGTYLVDRAIAAGASVDELVTMPTQSVVGLADVAAR